MTGPNPPSQANFDRVARIYRWAEYLALGPLLEHVRMHFLPELSGCYQALVLGDGDGRFLERLLHSNRSLHAHAVDTSGNMLALLDRRCRFAARRLTTEQNSLFEIEPSRKTDVIVTHFVLDCFSQLEIEFLATRLAAATLPGTLWLISDFGTPQSRVLRPFAAVYIRILYFFFRILTDLRVTQLPNPKQALSMAGFELRNRRQWLDGFLYSELWQRGYNQQDERILQSMNDTEVSNLHNDAQSDPEPPAPSLPEPDPGVFHHDVTTTLPRQKVNQNA